MYRIEHGLTAEHFTDQLREIGSVSIDYLNTKYLDSAKNEDTNSATVTMNEDSYVANLIVESESIQSDTERYKGQMGGTTAGATYYMLYHNGTALLGLNASTGAWDTVTAAILTDYVNINVPAKGKYINVVTHD